MARLSTRDMQQLLEAARLAPSSHNTQPWKFSVEPDALRVLPDRERRLPTVDPDEHALYISLGCAVENIVAEAGHLGYRSDVRIVAGDQERYVKMTFERSIRPPAEDLHAAIRERQSTRRHYDSRRIPVADIRRLGAAARQPGVKVITLAGSEQVEAIVPLITEAVRIQYEDAAFRTELADWVRFNRRAAEERGDGIPAAALGLPPVPEWAGRLILRRMVRADAEARRQVRAVRQAAALFVFAAERMDPDHWIEVGRSFERVVLTATKLGIRHAHVNMPCEVPSVRAKLKEVLDLPAATEPLLLIRLGYARAMPRSPRRPLEELVIEGSA